MKINPIVTLFKSIALLVTGKARFPKEKVGATIVREDGQKFIVFRHVVIHAKTDRPANPQGVFRVWFHTKASPQGTRRLSSLTLFGFLGMPGFCSKLWLFNPETGEFGGIYEWDTVEDADHYDKSYAMKFSKWRSLPGKFWTDVFPLDDPRSGVHHPDILPRFFAYGIQK
jgi:hypothetical protein